MNGNPGYGIVAVGVDVFPVKVAMTLLLPALMYGLVTQTGVVV